MRRVFLFSLAIFTSLFFSQSVYAYKCSAGQTHCYEHTHHITDLAPTGCDMLTVTIFNNTAYYFMKDNTYSDSASPAGVSVDSDLTTPKDFPILKPSTSGQVIYVLGDNVGSSDKDKVDRTVRYVAYFPDANGNVSNNTTGAQFVLHLSKSSCNASLTSCDLKDRPCYCRGEYDGAPCIRIGAECKWYNYDGSVEPQQFISSYWDKNVNGCTNIPSSLSAGADFPSVSAVYMNPNLNSAPSFSCNTSTVCDASLEGNNPGTVNFTINPALIETLTITFPFNTQTPAGKIMKDSIYNNLGSKYVGLLGSYFSYQPVVVTNKTIAFSTLCNSANCPPPPSS